MIILSGAMMSAEHNYKLLASSSMWFREFIYLTTSQVTQILPLTSMVREIRWV